MPSGAPAPVISPNGTQAAANPTVTFGAAGSYTFLVTMTDINGNSNTSQVSVNVNQTVTSIAVAPSNSSVYLGGTQQITATGYDQFGNVMNPEPSFTWALASGGGSISTSGVYTAPSAGLGQATVTASSSGITSATAYVNYGPDVVWTNRAGGSWPTGSNWQGGAAASGTGYTADFSTLSLTGSATVTLDGARTIGNLVFGDTASYGWTLNTGSGGTLKLSGNGIAPLITVKNQTAAINAVLTGTQGLATSGTGTLTLTGVNTYTGTTSVNGGNLVVNMNGYNGGYPAGGAYALVNLGAYAVGSSGTLTLYCTTNTDGYGGNSPDSFYSQTIGFSGSGVIV
jgi:autotransporter-associated beta strand protein